MLLTEVRGEAGSSPCHQKTKRRVRCQVRNIAWGIIYNEELIEAQGIDESSAEVSKKQGWTLGYLCIEETGKENGGNN